ncbi:MAG TPA: hypothetical protein VFK57_20715 [Vicinamibacterales bacterium]|nr:hypothetical protein [Vicinamibacterales bacterium]
MTNEAHRFSFVRAIAAISGIYDGGVGLFLLLAADRMASLFGVSPAQPPIFSDLNGLFLVAVGIGYYFPYRDPVHARWYLWVMGPLLKGAGSAAFLLDYFFRGSPASFLLFAASDGLLAVLTLAALLRSPKKGTVPVSARPR